MTDSEGIALEPGDRVLVYRPGVTEVATVRVPDPRLGLTTAIITLIWDDGFLASYVLDAFGKPTIPSDWRIVRAVEAVNDRSQRDEEIAMWNAR